MSNRMEANPEPREDGVTGEALLRILTDGARDELARIEESVRQLRGKEPAEAVEQIDRSAWELGTLISDVADFHAYTSGRLEEGDSDFDLRVTADAIRARVSRGRTRGAWLALVRIRHDVPTLLRGSPGRLQDMILGTAAGLIGRCPEGVLRIDISKESEEGERVGLVFTCEVRASENPTAEQLASDRVRLVEALGAHPLARQDLRIQLARRIAIASGGSLRPLGDDHPVPGFELRLPFTMRAVEETAPAPAETVSLRGRRALIADVSAPRIQRLTGLLRLWGMDALVCADAAGARQALADARAGGKPVEFVMVDADLENAEWAFARAIRGDPAGAAVRMVLLFGVGLRGDALLAESVGYGAYLPRTVSVRELREGMSFLLRRDPQAKSASIVTRHTLADVRLEGIRILLVSADPVGALVVEAVLRRKGFQVDRAANVGEGAERCESTHYDFLVLDEGAMPPGELGLVPGLRALLDQHEPTPAAVLVEGSAEGMPPAEGPGDAVFVKPVDLESICQFCEGALYPDLAPPEPAPAAAGKPRDAAVVISTSFNDEGPVVFERERLETATMGVESLQRSVLDTYLEEMPRRIEAIGAALASDPAAAERELLSTRVMALTVGAFSTAVCLARLGERVGQAGEDEIALLVAQLQEEFERSAVELRKVQIGTVEETRRAA